MVTKLFIPPRDLLTELEPAAERLLNRHLDMAKEWFPHDFIPYSVGRDFDKDPWTPDQPRISGVAQIAFEVNLLTEETSRATTARSTACSAVATAPGSTG